MSINFTARHTKVTPDIEKYCQKRIKNLEKFLGRPIEADLILSVEKYRQKAEIKVKSKRMTLNVTEETTICSVLWMWPSTILRKG